ncbi:hypothetical protein P8452_46382 [Trifolium repens]|nr:hypothetical protein P8452_46382 [Trifolium repens]
MLLWFFPVSFLLFVEGRVEKVRESKLASFLTLLGMVWLRWCMKRFEEKNRCGCRKKETHFVAMYDTVEHQTDRTICSIGEREFELIMPAVVPSPGT